MTILDTFYLLFESDASKLDKGLADSEKKATGLGTKLAAVDKAANSVGASMGAAFATLAGAAVAALSLSAMTSEMFQASEQADKLNESAERLGVNIETLGAWGDLVKKNGGSVDGFIGSIEGLNSQLQQMEVTGKSRAAPFLKELGIDLELAANKGKNALDFLPQIADAFAGMDKQKSVAIGKRLGLDQGTIMTLQAGRRAVEELLEKEKELGVVTKKQGEIADAFGDQMDDTRHAFRSVWLGVSEYVLPPLTWMMEKFQAVAMFMRNHSNFIVGIMIAIGAAIAAYVLPALLAMDIGVVLAFAPLILAGVLVAALGAAFALLYEDVMTFLDGGDSMLGQIFERWPGIGETVRLIANDFKNAWEVIKNIAGFLADVWNNPQAAFESFGEALITGMTAVGDFVMSIWNAIVSNVMSAISAIIAGAGKVASFFGIGGPDVAAGQAALAQASGSAMASQTSNSINNGRTSSKSTNVTVGKVEVHTQATDAAGISKAIGGSMQSQMRQAASNFDDGVLA